MTGITIGQLARQAGVGIETVRFYERRGLIEDPPRRPSGYRQYPAETVGRLRFIRRAKELGFSLKEIGELLQLRCHPAETRGQVRARAQAKIEDIDRRLADLSRMRETLSELADACERGDETEDCPILAALDGRAKDAVPR
ncbi:MAG: MerR family DNA-binding protein [Thermoanaerobaculia bacterium]|nr:MerR family DNA-binding protein [Thermoanaerobaculia bacterium]